MTEQELIAGAQKELRRNIAVAPIVIFVRIPLALLHAAFYYAAEGVMFFGELLPAWDTDYAKALRQFRTEADRPTPLPIKEGK